MAQTATRDERFGDFYRFPGGFSDYRLYTDAPAQVKSDDSLRDCYWYTYLKGDGATGYSKKVDVFCWWYNVLYRVDDPATIDSLRTRSRFLRGHEEPSSANLDAWIGRNPNDTIDGSTFFTRLEHPFWFDAISYDPAYSVRYQRERMSILFGKVHSLDILPGKNGDNFPSAVYWFNYCIAGECSDPDAFSDKIGVAEIHLAPDGRKIYQLPGPDLIVGAKSATGLALCGVTSEYRVVGQECYQVPTTFDELRAKFSSSGGQIDGVALQYARLWKSGNNAEWSKVLDALRGAESYYVAHCHSEQYSSEERLIHLTDSHVVCD